MALSFLLTGRIGAAPDAEALLASYSRSGSSKFLQQLIQLHGNDLYYFILKQSDAQMAEDICQQSWIKVMEKHQSFQGNSSFKTWLFSIGRNCLLDELRRRQRWQAVALEDENMLTTEDMAAALMQQQQQLAFSQQLALLPFTQREAVILQLEGFSLSDIAAITHEPAETIKSRLRYARQYLQQFAGGQYD